MRTSKLCALPNRATSHFQIVPPPNCTTSKLYHFQIVYIHCMPGLEGGVVWARTRLARGMRGRGLGTGTRLVACRAIMSHPQKTDFRSTFGSISSRDIHIGLFWTTWDIYRALWSSYLRAAQSIMTSEKNTSRMPSDIHEALNLYFVPNTTELDNFSECTRNEHKSMYKSEL